MLGEVYCQLEENHAGECGDGLLCPVHANLDADGKLRPFDNCIACIRNERDELRPILKESADATKDLLGTIMNSRTWAQRVRVAKALDAAEAALGNYPPAAKEG
jgi:hypothetical protein